MCSHEPHKFISTLYLSTLKQNIINEFTGVQTKNLSVIKVCYDNLKVNGDLYFLTPIKVWRGYVGSEYQNFQDIFEYYLHRKNKLKQNNTKEFNANEVLTSLISLSKNWCLKISSCCIRNDRVHIFLDRASLVQKIIKTTIEQGDLYGRNQSYDNKCFSFETESDTKSNLSEKRLDMIKDVTIQILKSQGYDVCNNNFCKNRYIFTTKSEGKHTKNYSKYICGVVKNVVSNEKESSITWNDYLQIKLDRLANISAQKLCLNIRNFDNNVLKNMANAVIIFEMLSVKPSRTVAVKYSNETFDTVKSAAFVLYNTARIAAIFSKYEEKQKSNEYPELLNIEKIDFSRLNEEEEWLLVFSIILHYPEMLHNAIKLEPVFEICPQHLCSFIQYICQIFSIYYRKTRILVDGYPHLIPTMMARMYLLKALEIVLSNSLRIINIDTVKCM